MTFRCLGFELPAKLSFALALFAPLLTVSAQNPTATDMMINGPDSLRKRMDTIGSYATAPGTAAIAVNVFAEHNGSRIDRQVLMKLVDTATQKAFWETTDDHGLGVFTNISYGQYDVEVSAVGFLSTHRQLLVSPTTVQQQLEVVLQHDPAAINLDLGSATLSPKVRKETKNAVLALKSGNLSNAEKHLRAAYQSAPSDPNLNFLLGYLFFQKKDYAAAVSHLSASTNADPHNAQALTLLGRAGLERSDYPVARSALEQAVLADPENWLPHNLLADTYLHQKDYPKARKEAELSISKGNATAATSQLILGEALLNLGQPAEGLQALQEFLHEDPQHPLAGQVRKVITEVEQRRTKSEPTAVSQTATQVAALDPLANLPAPKLSIKPWQPPGIDEIKVGVAPDVACPKDNVIEEAGKRAQMLVDDVARFAAIEDLFHQSLDEYGNPLRTETRKFNYVASITEQEPGYLAVDEYRTEKSSLSDYPDHIASTGFAALALVFHPHMRDSFEMVCEGLGDWKGQTTWLVHFRQRDDRPNRMHSYKVGNELHPVKLKGRAWITADKFQIIRMEAEMMAPIPEIRLMSEHQIVEYGPVPFPKKNTTLWLPKSAEIYFDFRKHRYYRRHSFDHYMLYSVDTEEKRKEPAEKKATGKKS